MGYCREHVEQFYGAVRSQDVRDVLCLRAKYGMHHTEIERLVLYGSVQQVRDGEIAATIDFVHKRKKLHRLSIDAQALAALRRLQSRGFAPSKDWTLKMCHKTAEQNGMPMVFPEELRHSFATWMENGGELIHTAGKKGVSRAQTAALMGHTNADMTARYTDSPVPPMAKVNVQLFHPEDPPIAGRRIRPNLRAVK